MPLNSPLKLAVIPTESQQASVIKPCSINSSMYGLIHMGATLLVVRSMI
ncbi:hypothetical protein RintRC_6904 [Richelia intracellularis]|nr:hypothetical protein RintRC_6904 [Richelia intracellularis]